MLDCKSNIQIQELGLQEHEFCSDGVGLYIIHVIRSGLDHSRVSIHPADMEYTTE